jgi:tetratricopeptide (TPR) repeat protein
MKTLTITITLAMVALICFSQKDQYETTMKTNIDKLYQSKTIEEHQLLANTFERIAMAEKRQWLPSYYASYCYIMMAFMAEKPDQIDPYLDLAQKHLDNALAVEPKDAELFILQGMLHQARISVDFMSRGMVYSQKAQGALEEAVKLDPKNPRAFYLMGMNLYSTPKMYGGGPQVALPLFKKAQENFELGEAINNDLKPVWGKENNEQMIMECEQNN